MNIIPILMTTSALLMPLRSNQAATQADKAEVTKIERIFKVDDQSKYSLTFDDAGGASMKAKLTVKTVKLLDKGMASQELKITELEMGPNSDLPPAVTWDFLNNGLPTSIDMQEHNIPFMLLAICSYVPGQAAIGKEFAVSYTSSDKNLTIAGKGTFEGIKEVDGKKEALVKTTLDVTPGGQQKGTVHNTAYFEPETGKLLKAEGTVDIGDGAHTMTYKVSSDS